MKKTISILVVLVLMLASSFNSIASHTAGGELIYEKVANTLNTYTFYFKFYRNCANLPANGLPPAQNAATEPATFPLCYTSPCTGTVQQVNMTKLVGNIPTNPPVPNGSTLSNGCDSTITMCESLTSPIPGYEQWWYSATVTLPVQCNQWRFFTYLCCRNNNVINIGPATSQTYDIYVETQFDNLTVPTAQDNSSPYFLNSNSSSSLPIPYMCVNSPYVHNGGAFDPDGDSLHFELIAPRDGVNCTATLPPSILAAGYNLMSTAGQPMDCANTFNMDPNTGTFTLTPNTVGKFAIAIKCSEYRNGVYLGSIMRDMQVVVDNCVPMPVSTILDSINIVNGNVVVDTVKSCPGANLNFCFDIVSNSGIYLQHLFNNSATAFPGSTISITNTSDSVLNVCLNWQSSLSDTGFHYLFINVKDSINCLTNPAVVSVPIFIRKPMDVHNDTTICAGSSINIWALANNSFTWGVVPGGTPNIVCLNPPNCDSVTVTPLVNSSYIVTDNVCNFIDTIDVNVVFGPTINLTPDTTTCVNSTLQLDVSALPSTQLYNYSWVPATGLSSTTIANPILSGNALATSTTYTVTVSAQGILGCPSTATVLVDILRGYDILNNDTTICDGDAVQILSTGGNPKYTYSWTPTTFVTNPSTINATIAPTPMGTYPYTFTASFPGCPDSVTILNIGVQPIPIVSAGNDREMCKGDTVHLKGSVLPANGNFTYQWNPASDLNNGTIIDPVFDGLSNASLTLTATTPIGCVGQDVVVVDVIPVDFMNINGDRNLCPNTPTTLTVGGAISYLWSPANMVSDSTATTVTVMPTTTTTFYVYGKDIKGCNDTVQATVVVNPEAVVSLGDDVTIYPGESTQLYASGNCSYFSFFPPNGLSSTTIKNPIAQPSVTTRYFVTAKTEDGCETTDSIDVIVSPESIIEVPNAFSPGSGTSINDEFKIILKGVATLNSFTVFNRWGQEVFNTKDINKGWNGLYNGKPQPMGAYIYVIDAVTSSGKRFYKQGNLTLIR